MRKIVFLLMSLSFFHNILGAEALSVGSKAPSVQSVDHTGAAIDLGEAFSEGTVLVFFYPKAMTPGCTKQACSLRDGWDELNEREVKVFGISTDTAETQAEFREKYELPFTLIADRDKSVAKAFGKNRWSRQAYLFQDGVLVWRDLSASTSQQMADVIEALDSLNKKGVVGG
jgi:peroxiredoxin Q/BCP